VLARAQHLQRLRVRRVQSPGLALPYPRHTRPRAYRGLGAAGAENLGIPMCLKGNWPLLCTYGPCGGAALISPNPDDLRTAKKLEALFAHTHRYVSYYIRVMPAHLGGGTGVAAGRSGKANLPMQRRGVNAAEVQFPNRKRPPAQCIKDGVAQRKGVAPGNASTFRSRGDAEPRAQPGGGRSLGLMSMAAVHLSGFGWCTN
jgi:hypothetical protein